MRIGVLGAGDSVRRLEGIALFALGLIFGGLTLARPVSEFDEGLILVGAERLLHGELPHRDFFTLYPAGQYVTVAGLFALFGTSALTLRIYCVVVRSIVALFVFLLARRLAGTGWGLASWAGALLWSTAFANFGYPVFPALALVLLSLHLLLVEAEDTRPAKRGRASCLIAAGGALGLAAYFRHDLAAYGALAALLLLGPKDAGERAAALPEARRERAFPPAIGLLAASCAAVIVPLALWTLATTPWRDVFFQLFEFPATTYVEMRELPYPPLVRGPWTPAALFDLRRLAEVTPGIPFFGPIALGVIGLAAAALPAVRRSDRLRFAPARTAALASLALLTLLLANLARVRSGIVHAVPAAIVSFTLAAAMAGALARGAGLRRALLALGLAISGLVAVGAVGGLRFGPASRLAALFGPPEPGLRAAHLPVGTSRREAARYLREVVPEDGRIFVGCGRHDRIFVNEPILYFLSGRLPGTRHHALEPGVATTRHVQEEIRSELERHRVEFVVLSTRNDERREPNGSSVSSGVTLLDDYLREAFRPVAEFPPSYTVLRRKTGPPGSETDRRATPDPRRGDPAAPAAP